MELFLYALIPLIVVNMLWHKTRKLFLDVCAGFVFFLTLALPYFAVFLLAFLAFKSTDLLYHLWS